MPRGKKYTRDELLAMQDTDPTRYLSLSKKRKEPEILEDRANFVEKRQKTNDTAASPSAAASCMSLTLLLPVFHDFFLEKSQLRELLSLWIPHLTSSRVVQSFF